MGKGQQVNLTVVAPSEQRSKPLLVDDEPTYWGLTIAIQEGNPCQPTSINTGTAQDYESRGRRSALLIGLGRTTTGGKTQLD